MSIPAHEAKSRLIEGNKRFINATSNPGDVSLERRVDTLKRLFCAVRIPDRYRKQYSQRE